MKKNEREALEDAVKKDMSDRGLLEKERYTANQILDYTKYHIAQNWQYHKSALTGKDVKLVAFDDIEHFIEFLREENKL